MITVQFFKYPDRLHWRHETHRLGEDEHGVWLGASTGAIVQRGAEAPMGLNGPTVQLIPPRRLLVAHLQRGRPQVPPLRRHRYAGDLGQ